MRVMRPWCVVLMMGWMLACSAVALARPVPLLWTVSAGQAEVSLLGSFHMLRAEDHPLDEAIERAYAAADRLVFEVDPTELRSPTAMRGLMAAARFQDGRTLGTVLPEDVRARLVAFMGEPAVAGSDSLQPWFLTLNMAMSVIVQAGFSPAHGIDMHFMQRAERDGKPVGGLETVDDQIRALSGAPVEEQVIALDEMLQPLPQLRERFDELHAVWRRGDAERLEQLMLDELEAKTPVSARLINTERNARWLPQIEAMLAEPGNTLVVVGALHLVGEVGLVERLRAAGYRVERVGVR